MKIAIVHDFLPQYGGAERVVEALHGVFPEAPVFTSLFVREKLPASFGRMDVRTTFMQALPMKAKLFKAYLPFYPFAMRSLDLRGFDVVLSSSIAFAKGVRVPPGTLHLCYCYTPMRYVWRKDDYLAKEKIPAPLKLLLPPVLAALKAWDLRTVGGVHHYVAISDYIRDRIKDCYGRDSEVIYPPVDVDGYPEDVPAEDYYLIVSRLVAYKRIDLAIEACNRAKRPLWIVGEGNHGPALRAMAGPTVKFLGRLPQAELERALARCRAFIFPGEEDFGIAPVEAMAAGRPVVAFGSGGALETVVEGETGVFFRTPTADAIVGAMDRLETLSIDPARCRRQADLFSKARFQKAIRAYVEQKFAEHLEKR